MQRADVPASPVTVSLNFMPAFYHRHLGLSYGEAYYFDPGYRAAVERSAASRAR